ncbi:hypothetical protein OCU04_007309 [Sclerotinia nivalis]|uniref:Alb1-domain-containing protein n=1 Tax=Sclerotinia nivalis TaxID=352851 RepID=A0A9X0ALI8_9HELO|nr:hypothetical protein OCU04_007309 [Sclerotinia nivalis]
MGKTAPLKNKGSTSVRSRAAKRASSPSIDTDKSLKNVKAPTETVYHPQVLSPHQGAGVSKKKNGRKSQLSSKAKRRQDKGLDRAEAVMDRTSTKIEKSKYRGRNVQERAKTWETLNKKAQEAVQAAIEKENEVSEEEDVEDDHSQGEIEMDDASAAPVAPIATDAVQSIPLPTPLEDEEEIL